MRSIVRMEKALAGISNPRTVVALRISRRALYESAVGSRNERVATIIIDVTDSQGRSKELRVAREVLQRFSKATILQYLKHVKVAQQIETAQSAVSITEPL